MALNFHTGALRGPEDRLALTRAVGRLQMEFTCMYTKARKYGGTKTLLNLCTIYYFRTKCRQSVESLRQEILKKSLESGGQDSQYVNTPSCQDEDWGRRYFGDNYGKLLAIKKLWDPKNIFNYCQSVGSKSSSCCL